MRAKVLRQLFLWLLLGPALGLLVGAGVCLYIGVTMNMDVPAAEMTQRMGMHAGVWCLAGVVLVFPAIYLFGLSIAFAEDSRTELRSQNTKFKTGK